MKTRIDSIDVAKAIALFTVIVGHGVVPYTPTFTFIFAFHMMFFFFATGYTLRIHEDESFKEYVTKKAKGLLYPYFVFSIVGICIMLVFKSWRTGNSILWYIEKYLYYTKPPALGQLWFLACTFVCMIMMYGAVKLSRLSSTIRSGNTTRPDNTIEPGNTTNPGNQIQPSMCQRNIIIVAEAVIMAAIGYFIVPKIYVPYFERMPWKIDTGIMAVSFMLLGYLANQTGILRKVPTWLKIVGAFALPVIVYVVGVKHNTYVNICDMKYGSLLCFYTAALAGILWMIDLGWILRKSKSLTWLGRNTLPIFCIHSFFLWAWIRVWCKFVIHEDIEFLPEGWALYLISIVTYISCIPVALLWNRLKSGPRRPGLIGPKWTA